MKLFVRVLVFGGLIGLGVWLWIYFNPSPQEAIRRQLTKLAEAASFDGPQGMVSTAVAAQGFASFFAPEVRMTIEPRGIFAEDTTRQEISQTVAVFRSRSSIRSLKVKLLDPIITLGANKQNAIVEATIHAETAGERYLIVQEVKFTMKEVEGKWLIFAIETVRTLNQAPAHPAKPPLAA